MKRSTPRRNVKEASAVLIGAALDCDGSSLAPLQAAAPMVTVGLSRADMLTLIQLLAQATAGRVKDLERRPGGFDRDRYLASVADPSGEIDRQVDEFRSGVNA